MKSDPWSTARSTVFHAVAALLAAFAVVLAIDSPARAQARAQSIDPASAAFSAAENEGLVMKGLRDTDGLRRIIEHYVENASLFGIRARQAPTLSSGRAQGIDRLAEAVRAAGMEVAAMRELESLVRGMDVSIYRVEFLPGLTGLETPGGPSLDVWDPGSGLEDDDSGLTPRIPRGQSLVSSEPVAVRHTNSGGLRTSERSYADGSTWYRAKGPVASGDYIVFDRTTHRDGTTAHYHLTIHDGETGEVRSEERWDRNEAPPPPAPVTPTDEEPSQAEAARQREERREGGREGSGEDDGGGETEEPDQYQPAEGGGGTFCPLLVEMCRRALQDLEESKSDILVGMVLVNPGDPDDQPEGSRLVFDPEGLVVNPNPQTVGPGRGERGELPRFRMKIPVLINPPGPSEE